MNEKQLAKKLRIEINFSFCRDFKLILPTNIQVIVQLSQTFLVSKFLNNESLFTVII